MFKMAFIASITVMVAAPPLAVAEEFGPRSAFGQNPRQCLDGCMAYNKRACDNGGAYSDCGRPDRLFTYCAYACLQDRIHPILPK